MMVAPSIHMTEITPVSAGLAMTNAPRTNDKASILVVDDSPANLLTVETVLQSLGEEIITARSGREALRRLLNQDFAVILVDVNMPEMDGFETATMIRQRKRFERTPIIFMSAVSRPETHALTGYSLGAVDYIFTPIQPEILKTKVSVFVDLYKKTLEVERQGQRLRQSERLASIGTLAAGMAHEINNPLNSILLAAQYAIECHDDVEPYEVLRTIQAEAERAAQIVKAILKFARDEKTPKTPCDLNVVVRHAADLAKTYVRSAGVMIEFDLASGLPPVALCATEIEQVLVNLVKNAAEASGHGVRIRFATVRDGERVRLSVEDNGPGIAQERLGHVFDPFYTTKRQSGGSGLGLSICHGIVSDHGGTIEAQSRTGEGATFVIYFPIWKG